METKGGESGIPFI